MKGGNYVGNISWENYILDKVIYVENNILYSNYRYVELMEKQNQLIKQINSILPKEHKSLTIELSDNIDHLCATISTIMYSSGIE